MRLSISLLVLLVACSSAPLPDPTPARPRIGCIADSPVPTRQLNKATGNRLLPEVVRVIGTYPHDESKWMLLRQGEFDATKWQPWPKEKIQFNGCGPEADAIKEIY